MCMFAEKIHADLLIRPPTPADAAAVHALIARCPPLDTNSMYCNLLQCTHHRQTCALAETESEPGDARAFVSAYRLPEHQDSLFIWQVAVDERARGGGLGGRLISEILGRPACRGVEYLRTTITLDNAASWAMFRSLAQALEAETREHKLFDSEQHFGNRHASEHELTIGPLDLSSITRKGVQ